MPGRCVIDAAMSIMTIPNWWWAASRCSEIRCCCAKEILSHRKGKWTLPAGYLENGETVQEGAVRETLEETRSRVDIIAPYRMFNLVFVHQIYLMFRAKLLDNDFGPTKESAAVQLFRESEIPWENIAFESIRQTLADFFSDRSDQAYPFEIKQIMPPKQHVDPA